MKILIVDDEKLIRDVIREYCHKDGFDTIEAENGIEALKLLEKEKVDAIVLDIMMPKMDGYTFFKEIKDKYYIPTIIVSARNDEYDKLSGFDLGIDDYLTKPFSPRELIARIKAIIKRSNNNIEIYQYKGLKVDLRAHAVYIKDKEVKITLKEFELLKYFIRNINKAIAREELLNKIWGYDFYGDDRTVDTHIKMLRSNLGKYRELITTVHGIGYKFEEK